MDCQLGPLRLTGNPFLKWEVGDGWLKALDYSCFQNATSWLLRWDKGGGCKMSTEKVVSIKVGSQAPIKLDQGWHQRQMGDSKHKSLVPPSHLGHMGDNCKPSSHKIRPRMTSKDQGWPLGHIWEAGGERFNANVGFPKSSHQIKLKIPSDQTKAVELIFALPPSSDMRLYFS